MYLPEKFREGVVKAIYLMEIGTFDIQKPSWIYLIESTRSVQYTMKL